MLIKCNWAPPPSKWSSHFPPFWVIPKSSKWHHQTTTMQMWQRSLSHPGLCLHAYSTVTKRNHLRTKVSRRGKEKSYRSFGGQARWQIEGSLDFIHPGFFPSCQKPLSFQIAWSGGGDVFLPMRKMNQMPPPPPPHFTSQLSRWEDWPTFTPPSGSIKSALAGGNKRALNSSFLFCISTVFPCRLPSSISLLSFSPS